LSTVAVIVAARNARETIGSCIESLLAADQAGHDVRIVVVDNASSDGTAEAVRRFADRVTLIPETRPGPAAARNRGIVGTGAELVAFTDSDCVVERDWLAELVAALADPNVGIAGGPILSVRPCNRIELFGERIHDQRAAMLHYEPPYALSGSWASPRRVLLEAGLFDERLLRGSDADMAFRIRQLGLSLKFVEGAVVRHRNERTLAGLFREGVMHGRGRAGIRVTTSGVIRPGSTRRGLLKSMRELIAGGDGPRFDAMCAVVFNGGKLLGELRGPLPGAGVG
jgi:glycosyltransferase involved in cell wall biosynthesis